MAFNLNSIALGNLLGKSIGESQDYKQDMAETGDISFITFAPLETMNVTGSAYVYTKTLGSSTITGSTLVSSTDIIAYYPFEGNANDYFGNYNGTVTNATLTASGILGSAYSLDGTADYITASPPSTLFDGQSQFSVSCWVKPTTVSSYKCIACNRTNTDIKHWVLYRNSGTLGFDIYGSVSSFGTTSSIGLSAGSWHHIVGTYNSGVSKLYVNGVFGGSSTSGTITTMGTLGSTTLRIGRNTESAGTQDFNGIVDEFGIWKRELTSTEVTNLYNSGAGRLVSNWVVGSAGTYYPFYLDHPNILYNNLDSSTIWLDGDFRTTNLVSSTRL